jgi:hypothetical protein
VDKEKYNRSFLFLASFVFSIILHFAAIVLVKYVTNLSLEKPLVNPGYVLVTTGIKEKKQRENLPVENKEEKNLEDKSIEPEEVQESELTESSFYINFDNENADTTLLEQLYSEQTLNVRVKYPAGWKFIDQNNNGKLDGVTFWASASNYNPPPYIHLEVKEKYLFSKNRYQYSREMNDFTAYFNDPEELSGQVSQEVYCRTESENDFNLKLIINGREQFNSFQPRFFGMIKSFKFGKTLF